MEVLRAARIFAGDPILIRKKNAALDSYAVGVAWPSNEVEAECE